MNVVYESDTFSKLFDAAEKREQEWIDGIRDQLSENLRIGKPLRFDWFREKKLGNVRLYYLINEKSRKALLVAFGPKKEQQSIINHNRERYLRLID